jgi:hypothetical protein
MPALEAVLAACRDAGCDLIVHCGDFLSTPFTPDPPEETIALLRAEGLQAIIGNGEAYLRDWGMPRYETDLALRRERSDPIGPWIELIADGQAELTPSDLAWLRTLPDELVLDCARPGDVYVCHGMPGNPFSAIWPGHLTSTFDRHITPAIRDAALSQSGPAQADLILCGHVHLPLVLPTILPNGRMVLAIRGQGVTGDAQSTTWLTGCVILTHRSQNSPTGYVNWEIAFVNVPFVPRDPSWTWKQPPRRSR